MIAECYSTGSVSGHSWVGGLVGGNGMNGAGGFAGGTITRCYSTGDIKSTTSWYVGGLVGENLGYCSDISDCYWDIQTSNEPNMCGRQEEAATGCNNSYGKTTSEMHQQSTFTDWDFINVWNIGESQTYPYLRTHAASDINKDNITNFLDLCIMAEQWCEER